MGSALAWAKVLVAEIEQDFVNVYTKVTLAKCKADSVKFELLLLPPKHLWLDPLAEKIDSYLAKKADMWSIGSCSICRQTRSTVG